MLEHFGKAIAVGLLGAALGWGGAALTLSGRVDAIERGLLRIEAQLDRIADTRGAREAAKP